MCSEIIAGSWCQNNNLEIMECTYGPLKLFWNKHFPEVIKWCSVAKSIRTMNFIDLKYTIQYLLTLPKVHVLSFEWFLHKSVEIFWDYTHMKWDPSVSCGWTDSTGEDKDSGDGDRLFTAIVWFSLEALGVSS